MIIDIGEYLSQRDPRWSGDYLGIKTKVSNKSTLGQYGCVVTSLTMLANSVSPSQPITPPEMNRRLEEVNGFTNSPPDSMDYNLAIWAKVDQVVPGLRFSGAISTPGALTRQQFQLINYYLAHNLPVVTCVDFSPASGLQKHYVLLVGYQEGNPPKYLMADPWHHDKQAVLLTSRYGKTDSKAIYRIVLFNSTVAGRSIGGQDHPIVTYAGGPTV